MKKIIPPYLFLFCIILMLILDSVFASATVFVKPINYMGLGMVFLGLLITVRVRKQFEKKQTEIHTFKDPKNLVTDGLFKVSRNPIYLGFAISLIGVWVFLGSFLPLVGCILFVIVTNFWYIPYEEKVMRQKFGDDYRQYESRIRRWI